MSEAISEEMRLNLYDLCHILGGEELTTEAIIDRFQINARTLDRWKYAARKLGLTFRSRCEAVTSGWGNLDKTWFWWMDSTEIEKVDALWPEGEGVWRVNVWFGGHTWAEVSENFKTEAEARDFEALYDDWDEYPDACVKVFPPETKE